MNLVPAASHLLEGRCTHGLCFLLAVFRRFIQGAEALVDALLQQLLELKLCSFIYQLGLVQSQDVP